MTLLGTLDGTAMRCYCGCGGKLGEMHPREKLEIQDKRHGRRHIVSLSPLEVFESMSGTKGTGIVDYVRRLVG